MGKNIVVPCYHRYHAQVAKIWVMEVQLQFLELSISYMCSQRHIQLMPPWAEAGDYSEGPNHLQQPATKVQRYEPFLGSLWIPKINKNSVPGGTGINTQEYDNSLQLTFDLCCITAGTA